MKQRSPVERIGYFENRYVGTECYGCQYKEEGLCSAYLFPRMWFRHGKVCPLATHLAHDPEDPTQGRVRVGQQKQRKGGRGR